MSFICETEQVGDDRGWKVTNGGGYLVFGFVDKVSKTEGLRLCERAGSNVLSVSRHLRLLSCL